VIALYYQVFSVLLLGEYEWMIALNELKINILNLGAFFGAEK